MIARLSGLLAACLLLAGCGSPGGIQHTDIPPLPGHKAAFDQALVDQSTRRLYVADEGLLAVDVFDVSRNPPRYVTSVRLGKIPHGLAASKELHKVFVGLNGGGIAVLETDNSGGGANRVLDVIQTSAKKNVDLVDYNPASHQVWAAASDEGILFQVDAIRDRVMATLPIAPTLEQPRVDPRTGVVYVPDTDKNTLYEVDPYQVQVVQQWSLGVACGPTGLAIDSARQVAMIGCRDPHAGHIIAWDLKTGTPIRTLSDVQDVDQVIYDAGAGLYMAAGRAGAATAIGFFGGSPPAYRAVKITHADSRAVAYDEASQTVYTPDAKPGNEGLISFPAPRPVPPANPWVAPLLYLIPLVLVGIGVWSYGSRRARQRRLAGRPMYS